jgi:hypothetical protein
MINPTVVYNPPPVSPGEMTYGEQVATGVSFSGKASNQIKSSVSLGHLK